MSSARLRLHDQRLTIFQLFPMANDENSIPYDRISTEEDYFAITEVLHRRTRLLNPEPPIRQDNLHTASMPTSSKCFSMETTSPSFEPTMTAQFLDDAPSTLRTASLNASHNVGNGPEHSSRSSHQGYVPRRQMELPIILRNPRAIGDSTIMSRPDSGSEENVMTADVAHSLLLDIDSTPACQKDFRVANGKLMKSIGRTMVHCGFAKEPTVELRCFFYVFWQLISPVIMGMAFLDETETLVKYRHRLQPRSVPPSLPFQICSLNYPRRQLYCLANSQPKFANADTGSEIDLMSLAYVQKRRFTIEKASPLRDTVQFADGSTSRLVGKVNVGIQIGADNSPCYWREFHILTDLICDILLGEDFLEDTAAFESYSNAFALDDEDDGFCEVNTIVWFNLVESKVSRILARKPVATDHSLGKFLSLFLF